jgi:hypothetical protein
MSNLLLTRDPFRGSFVSLTSPSLPPGETDEDKKRYQITIAYPKNHPFWKQVAKAIKATAVEKWGKWPAKGKKPVRDGDDILDDDDELKYPEFEGCYTLQASSKRRPGLAEVREGEVVRIDEPNPDDYYSGAWYRATIEPYAWTHPTGGKGVSFALNNVMKVKDDDPLGGGTRAEDDFAEFAEAESDDDDASADDLLN